MVGTKYGDGGYPDENGTEYSVDSGTLGLVPIDDVHPERRGDLDRLGKVVTFTKPVDISYDEGRISFGDITINTGEPDPEPCVNCGRDTDASGYCGYCGDPCEMCMSYDCEGECANCSDCGEHEDDCRCDDEDDED